jgi:HK97 family phage major capsid protein
MSNDTRKEVLKQIADKKAKMSELDAVITRKEAESEDTASDQSEFDAIDEAVGKLEKRLDRIAKIATNQEAQLEESEEKSVSGYTTKSYEMNTNRNFSVNKWPVYGVKQPEREAELMVRKSVIDHIAKENGWGLNEKLEYVAKEWKDGDLYNVMTTKAGLSSSLPVIPQGWTNDFIKLRRESVKLLPRLDVRQMPLGNLTIPRQRTGAIASFLTEGSNASVSNSGWDNIDFTFHKYSAITYTTKELVMMTPLDIISAMTQDLALQCGLKAEQVVLLATGSNNEPTGIVAQADSSVVYNDSAQASSIAPTYSTAWADLKKGLSVLRTNLVPEPYFLVGNYDNFLFLETLNSTMGLYPIAEQLRNNRLWDYEIIQTAIMPTNLGTGSNQAQIVGLSPASVIVAETGGFDLTSTSEGSFYDNVAGAPVYTFGSDQVAFKATGRMDVQMAYPNGVFVLNVKNWNLASAMSGKTYATQSLATTITTASGAIY